MGKFSQFHYWKNGVFVGKKGINKLPRNAKEKLSFYQIQNGDYDESPYWKMSLDEEQNLKDEISNWKSTNYRASEDAFQHWFIHRRRVYNKKIQKLREAHQDYEISRLDKLKKQLILDFGKDVFEIVLENNLNETLTDFYYSYKLFCHETN